MRRVLVVVTSLLAMSGLVAACTPPPGAGVIGSPTGRDPYFPAAGNGGYEVADYDLTIAYTPDTRAFDATAVITANALASLSRFNLDLRDLTVTFKDASTLKLRSSFNSSQLGTKFASDVLEIESVSGVTVSERGRWSFTPPAFKVSIAMNAEARAALDLCLRLITAPPHGRALTLEFMRLNSPAENAYTLSSTVLDVIRPLEMGFINCSLE